MIVYVTQQGSEIIKDGRHLCLKKDTYKETLFTHKIKQLVLFGNIKITHPALVQLIRYEIDVVFLTQSGQYLGRLELSEPKNIFLRKKQFALNDNKEFGLKMAKSIVAGKIANLVTVLMRIQRTKKLEDVRQKAVKIKDLLHLLESATTIDSVRGYEGKASAIYFSAFGAGFVSNPGFFCRVRRPPTDPVNSLLSLLYTFLMNRVYTATRLAFLDPYLGSLHTNDYGRHSLVLDLMEEFRPIIVDTLVLSLFNLNMLSADSFEQELPQPDELAEEKSDQIDVLSDPIGLMTNHALSSDITALPEQRMEETPVVGNSNFGKYPVKIKPDAMVKVIDAFERKLTARFQHPLAGKELSYAEAINFQAQYYRRVVEGEVEVYSPLLLK